MENFLSLKLEETLFESLAKINFKAPTPIQAKAIPIALEGKDILGTAQTGTGKTGAFGIPLVNHLLKTKKETALVITPTRELAAQVAESVVTYGKNLPIRSTVVFGGVKINPQMMKLRRGVDVLVATPGRLLDLYNQKAVRFDELEVLVLDEADRMLDMGFTPQIEMILKFVPKDHQTLLFSATLPQNILRISERYLNKPERISTGATSVPIAKIKQEILQVFKENKYNELIDQFLARKGSILVFVKTKRGADKMVKKLKEEGHSADAIHGDLGIIKRDDVIICISKSGNTPEIKELVPFIKMNNNQLIAITGDKSSFLAKNSSRLRLTK